MCRCPERGNEMCNRIRNFLYQSRTGSGIRDGEKGPVTQLIVHFQGQTQVAKKIK